MAKFRKEGNKETPALSTASLPDIVFMARYEQVRIPLTITDDKGRERAIDTRAFVTNLRKYLSGAPFNLTSKVYMRGLGEAWLIIGEK